MPAAVQRIGLTGGIGSGKSTVARVLRQLGAAVVDADAISRQLTAVGGGAIAAISRQLGSDLIGPDGAMNRDAVRALVFREPGARLQLEAIVHPLINEETARQDAAAVASGQRCVVYDIPLLVESPRWRGRLDRVLVVDCLPSTQIDRVMARELARPGWSRSAVEQVMAVQASRAQRLAAADICVYNDGVSLDGLTQILGQMATGFGL
ncbi:MAG: dephospho-CoA kinase [Polaromonas sp.]